MGVSQLLGAHPDCPSPTSMPMAINQSIKSINICLMKGEWIVQLYSANINLQHARDLCMLSASYDPTVYPNPRFMKWQEQPPWHVFCTPLQPDGASPVLLTGHELSVFCNEQSEWGIFRMLCRMPQSWSQRLRLDCWLRLFCGLITFFAHYSLQ